MSNTKICEAFHHDADDDAKHGQQTAQPIGAQGAQGHAHGFPHGELGWHGCGVGGWP